ncbi:MAG: hypothetical protein AABZ39_06160 [Spirochaetota bacterium]
MKKVIILAITVSAFITAQNVITDDTRRSTKKTPPVTPRSFNDDFFQFFDSPAPAKTPLTNTKRTQIVQTATTATAAPASVVRTNIVYITNFITNNVLRTNVVTYSTALNANPPTAVERMPPVTVKPETNSVKPPLDVLATLPSNLPLSAVSTSRTKEILIKGEDYVMTNIIVVRTNLSELILNPSDIFFRAVDGTNFDIFIKRKNEYINSVLLLNEVSVDNPDNYALRATNYNKINGEEWRYLDGKWLSKSNDMYYLIDSSVDNLETVGSVFRIRVPQYCVYGYDRDIAGIAKMEKGRELVVRTFSKKYGDYTGSFQDNLVNIPPNMIGDEVPMFTYEGKTTYSGLMGLTLYYQDFSTDRVNFMIMDSLSKSLEYEPLTVYRDDTVRDRSAVLLEARVDRTSGKRMYKVRVYINTKTERVIKINVFTDKGESFTRPIVYRIVTQAKPE